MKFYKYCASGNDFIITNSNIKQNKNQMAKKLCDRYSGIGADGLIIILPHEKYDFEWEFYNSDGSMPQMCGNGSRAAAHFAVNFLNKNKNLSFLAGKKIINAKIDGDLVEVTLGEPKDTKTHIKIANKIWHFCDTGVPHMVYFCENLAEFDLDLCKNIRKLYNANVNYAKIINDELIELRTFERGVEGETLACGTGMAASFYLGYIMNKLKNNAIVIPKSKEELNLKLNNNDILFKGKVKYCFEANI